MSNRRAAVVLAVLICGCVAGPLVRERAVPTRSGTRTKKFVASANLPDASKVAVVIGIGSPCAAVAYQPEMLWGGDRERPEDVVVAFDVTVRGEHVATPFSAYGDLAAPRDVRVRVDGQRRFDIVIRGGDTATAYNAVVAFDYNWAMKQFFVTRRRVSLDEFAEQVWEETNYSWHSGTE